MIITNLKTWTYEDSMEGLLFFAQRILELSYDKTDFSEKRYQYQHWILSMNA